MAEVARERSPLARAADPVDLMGSLGRALFSVALRPQATIAPTARWLGDVLSAAAASTSRLLGAEAVGPLSPDPHDGRFRDDAWDQNPFFYWLLQLYLLNGRLLDDLVEAAGLPEPRSSKAKFTARLLTDSAAPTNYLLTNPKALRRAFDTGGRSLARGGANWLRDVATNNGWPSQVDKGHFAVGKNLACTKGSVVLRNGLIELLQYEPLTPSVHSVPMLFCPPWINKYYIMDLSPGRSLVEWALQHGHTVFAISYRNPDSSMKDVSFEDYLFDGPRAAIDAVCSITGAGTVNTVSVCLGGTLNAALVAYLDATGENLVNSSTYLNTAIDFADAGVLHDVFTDEETVEALEARMAPRGYLEASDMAHTFDLLRANDLVFRYVESNWLLGEGPPCFDLLAWNNDSTRMPAKMHTYYLRKCWVENALAHDKMKLGGQRLFISRNKTDTYLVGALNDHIVPWHANYRTTQALKGNCRFVLSSGGHVAGIVNPPSPKSKFWVNDELPADPEKWRAGATEMAGTWWEDWAGWAAQRAGDLVPPPPMGNERYPVLGPAPGTYVLAR